jgi:hypothetical protein
MQVDSRIASQIHDYVESAAPPIPLASISGPAAAHGQTGRSASIRRRVSPLRAIALAAATAAAAAAVTIGLQETGGSHAHRSHEYTVLTAAMVHHVEAASQAAIVPAGHMLVTFTVGLINHAPVSSGSIDFTFSGQNFNAVDHVPASSIDAKSPTLTSRRVNGQIYIFGLPGRPRQWYHLQGQTPASRTVPDPRKLLTALQPEARFQDIGSQLIDGVPTRILSATQLKKLPASVLSALTFVSSMGPESLTAFDVWVDSHGVVRQMKIIHQAQSQQGRLIENQTIRFLDIGKPEKITAPARYINQTPGG